jgi:hypothetical protein
MVLKRPLHPMPAFVRDALEEDGLMASYDARPAYQRNDYLRWIASPRASRRGANVSTRCWTS